MKNLWNEQDFSQLNDLLAQRVYSSRLLGENPDLVLHGGGNTSVKGVWKNIFGEDEPTLFVKGSGSDLASITAKDFAPVRLNTLLQLSRLAKLSDTDMQRELRLACLDPNAPAPSVEAILHAVIPHRFVDHTHADAIVTLTNTPNGLQLIREIFAEEVIVLPYVMPGFDLAKLCAEVFAAEYTSKTIGMVLMNHGIFSFAETAKESYERMIQLVQRAEDYLQQHSVLPAKRTVQVAWDGVAELRKNISKAAGYPVLLKADIASIGFATHPAVAQISQRGPATPDHVIRTKRLPMVGRDVEAYVSAYQSYFANNTRGRNLTMLDPAPRVVLDAEFGLLSVGRSARDAQIVQDIYQHTQDIILRAECLGGYQALSEADLFDMEYWELEQAKLKKAGAAKTFAGEVALVTGAASGIGKACVASLLNRGAAVVGVDINSAVTELHVNRPDYLGITADLTDVSALQGVLQQVLQAYGGLDMLVLNAGIFPGGSKIKDLSDELWRKVMAINLDANLSLMRLAHPLLKLAPRYGRVVIIGSKNVPAPGPGAAAYSAAKAALTQLARVAALEWGDDKIRINTLHPNAVFDTGIWTEEVLQQRAKHYAMSVEEYKRNNVLHEEVSSHDVAELCAEMCGVLFSKITGAQLPIDGGNERVI